MFHPVRTLALLAATCGLAHASPTGAVADAYADAVDTYNFGGPLLDIASLGVEYDRHNLNVTMTFFNDIAPASADADNALTGFIEFDLDQDAHTGRPALQNAFAPLFPTADVGSEIACDLFSELLHPGSIDIVSTSTYQVIVTVPITYTERSLAFSVPLYVLDDDGRLNFTAMIGTGWQPTDAMGDVGTSVPGPSALALLSIGACFGHRRRRP